MDINGSFVLLSRIAPDIIEDIRYFSSYNFVGDPIDGYEEPCAVLTLPAAEALSSVSEELKPLGYRLKVFDAYRPTRAVAHFIRWAEDSADQRMKKDFYPDVDKSRLFDLGYIIRRSGHSRGSTADLTLFDADAGCDADMGSPFDYFSTLSHADCTEGLTARQLENRALLRSVMVKHGFTTLKEEWWHFTLENEPFPDTYFDFPVSSRLFR